MELEPAGVVGGGAGDEPPVLASLDVARGKRLEFGGDGGSRVIDGPFAEAKELIGGFWIWQVSSMEGAVEWLKRAPVRGTAVELRRVQEAAGFGGQIPQEIIDAGSRLREQSAQQRTR